MPESIIGKSEINVALTSRFRPSSLTTHGIRDPLRNRQIALMLKNLFSRSIARLTRPDRGDGVRLVTMKNRPISADQQ
ncbi:hypothetical protein DOFOFD_10125 [Acetobacteraceae bacterium EV16P]|uniref:Uncharacterized protein n=1 Tax=Sorlinia euscelidii TaxID=3081148 RepID=A0ABU7U5W6_9PROT